jgi:catechol-2,3-dioxygenase
MQVQSQITFFYYHDLTTAARFYEDVMGFQPVEDQGFARIYRVGGTAFMGIVAGERGFRKPQSYNACLLTLLVDNVEQWYEHLKAKGARLLTEIQDKREIQVRCFFLEDPAGYAIEVQQFLRPDLVEIFHTPK